MRRPPSSFRGTATGPACASPHKRTSWGPELGWPPADLHGPQPHAWAPVLPLPCFRDTDCLRGPPCQLRPRALVECHVQDSSPVHSHRCLCSLSRAERRQLPHL